MYAVNSLVSPEIAGSSLSFIYIYDFWEFSIDKRQIQKYVKEREKKHAENKTKKNKKKEITSKFP